MTSVHLSEPKYRATWWHTAAKHKPGNGVVGSGTAGILQTDYCILSMLDRAKKTDWNLEGTDGIFLQNTARKELYHHKTDFLSPQLYRGHREVWTKYSCQEITGSIFYVCQRRSLPPSLSLHPRTAEHPEPVGRRWLTLGGRRGWFLTGELATVLGRRPSQTRAGIGPTPQILLSS